MGIVIQAVWEDFYNKELWRLPEMRGAYLKSQLVKMTKGHLLDVLPRFYVDYDKMSFEEIEETCVSGVLGYIATMRHHKFLSPTYAKSEVDLSTGQIANWLPIGGRVDFIISRQDTGITILDGKNSATKMKYTDPDQLRWYALCFSLCHHKLPDRLGFVWFRYPYDEESGEEGVDWVDFNRRDLIDLAARAKKVRRAQEKEQFDPKPVAKNCRFCDFESVCDARIEQRAANSAKRKRKKSLPVVDDNALDGIVEFGFND